MTEGLVAPILGWVEAHPGAAVLLAFLVALVESVPLIGIFVPGSAILVGIGVLLGGAGVSPWPTVMGCVAGAVLGDALGYWGARWLGPRAVRRHVPVAQRRFYARAVLLFRRWGWLAVFSARFISPLRAVASLAAGVAGMREMAFQSANLLSALIWAPLLLMPGQAAGLVGALLDDRSDLLPWLLATLALIAVPAWLALRRPVPQR